jgi:hypothetical protein
MRFYLMKRKGKIMIYMEMRRAILDLMLGILGTRVGILISQMVDRGKIVIPSDQVTGRIWGTREIPGHFHFPLVVPVLRVHLVLA